MLGLLSPVAGSDGDPKMNKHRRNGARVAAAGIVGVLALTACAGENGATSGGTQDGKVTIGAILSLSGVYSTLGPPQQDALQMGMAKLNANGGFTVNGKKHTMDLKVIDDQSQAATVGVSAYRQLVNVDKTPVLLMTTQTASYSAAIKRAPLPILNIVDSTYPSILDVDPHLFLLRSDTPAYVPGAVYYAVNELKATKIAFIGASADPYSAGIETWVKKSAAKYGAKIVADVNYPAGTTNYAPFIQKAMAGNPQAIYLGGVTAEVLPVAKQLYESGVRGIPVLHNGGVTPDQAKAIIGEQLYNQVMTNNYDFAGSLPTTSDNPATKQFAADFQKKYNIYPSDLTMWAYDAPFVIANAMEAAGSVSDQAKIFTAMPNMKVPAKTVSGWIPTNDGKLFHDRDAQTLEEGLAWCPSLKTIKPAFKYFMNGFDFTKKTVIKNPCSAGS